MNNILVVDDEVGVCCVIQHLLVRQGHPVTIMTNGRAALGAVARDEYAAALIDLNLAEIDGNEVIRAARAPRPDMPIVMMSGMVLESGCGAPDFPGMSARIPGLYRLAKPFKPTDLIQLVQDIFSIPAGDALAWPGRPRLDSKVPPLPRRGGEMRSRGGLPKLGANWSWRFKSLDGWWEYSFGTVISFTCCGFSFP